MIRLQAILLLLFPIICSGQEQQSVWIIGTVPSVGNPSGYLDFSTGSPQADSLPNATMPMVGTMANICDSSGQLLFYTNGIWVANRNDDTMLNGYGITSGFGANWYNFTGSFILQGALILPHPVFENQYYLFAVNDDDSILFRPRRLVYSKVDMSLDGGLGGVTTKNVSIIDDTLTNGRITACKHADEKSWWLIAHEHKSSKYYKWLVTLDTILGPYEQKIGSSYGDGVEDIDGQSVFSQDGKKFATFGNNFKLNVMDFDRCTGEFSNNHSFLIPTDAYTGYGIGCAFSPNGRFLYFNAQSKLWQLDLDPDSGNFEIDTIGKYNGTDLDPFWTWFGLEMLAPDGKIYLGEWNGNLSMHVINNPNGKAAACDFQQHSFPLPVYNGTLPNFVNYDLESLPIYKADAGSDEYIYGIDTVQIGVIAVDSLIYEWFPNTTLSSSSIADPLAFPTTTTTYYLTILDTTETTYCNQRTDSVTVHVNEFPTGIGPSGTENFFTIFPNPSHSYLIVRCNNDNHFDLTLRNAFGVIIKDISSSQRELLMDISWLPNGVYFIETQNEKGKVVQKFVKQ